MTHRRMVLALLALAGVLVAHTLGYSLAHSRGAGLDHAYVFPALGVVAPIAVVVIAIAAVAEARRVGLAVELSVGQLLRAQLALYAVQEVGERLVHGDLGSKGAAPSVVLGALAQLPVALVLYRLVRLARKVAARLFTPSPAPPPTPPVAAAPPTDGACRTSWSPIASRAPPAFA